MENHILWFFLPFWLYSILQYFTLFYTLGALMSPFLWSNPLEVVSKPQLRPNGRVAALR